MIIKNIFIGCFLSYQVHEVVSPVFVNFDTEETAAEHVRQNQGSPVWGVGSAARVLMCTTMALLLFFFTLTIFSSFGLAGAAVAVAAGVALGVEEGEAEDFLNQLRNNPPLLPDRPTNKCTNELNKSK